MRIWLRMCRTYGAHRVFALTQPSRAGLKFGPGPPGLQDVKSVANKTVLRSLIWTALAENSPGRKSWVALRPHFESRRDDRLLCRPYETSRFELSSSMNTGSVQPLHSTASETVG